MMEFLLLIVLIGVPLEYYAIRTVLAPVRGVGVRGCN
jgi:hypothetical protein